MARKDLPCFIAAMLLRELPEQCRTFGECEKILKETLDVLKSVTLDNSAEERG